MDTGRLRLKEVSEGEYYKAVNSFPPEEVDAILAAEIETDAWFMQFVEARKSTMPEEEYEKWRKQYWRAGLTVEKVKARLNNLTKVEEGNTNVTDR